jgi:thioredoxin-like negative regulator of GroEL
MSTTSSLRKRFRGVETAKIAGCALLLSISFSRPGLASIPEKVEWPIIAAAAASDYQEARALLERRKWAEAAIILKSVLDKDPDYTPAAIQLAEALFYSNRREEGLSILAQMIGHEKGARREALIRRLGVLSRSFLSNTNFQAYQDGVNLLLARKYSLAHDRMDRVLRDEPANVEILVRLGESLVLDGDWDSAAERLKLARKLNPFEPETRLWLGRAMHERGELSESLEELKQAHNDLPSSELASAWLADALASSGQRDLAGAVLDQDLARYPLHVQSLLRLAELKIGGPHASRAVLMEARKLLQLAESRLGAYLAPGTSSFESELGLDLRKNEEELKTEIQKLFQRVEGRLDELNAEV